MKIVHYCQHVLGVGHVHRSMELCRALATRHEVTMITGGGPITDMPSQFEHYQLPGLMMDSSFKNLAPYDSTRNLEEVKIQRKKLLFNFFQNNRPDVFLIELYPFGRKSFRFELDPLLEGIRRGKLASCRIFCSLRDILVERPDKEEFEHRIISTLNEHFDGLLIHGDEDFIPLHHTFSRMGDIKIPVEYTGYVTPLSSVKTRSEVRKNLRIPENVQLLVASIGGGNVGSELLLKLAEAFKYINKSKYFLKLFTGPYTSNDDLSKLKKLQTDTLSVENFSPDFQDWLQAADLSVSMAGYNTTMNILSAGIPALVYPFTQNNEQSLRIDRLCDLVPIKKLNQGDLKAETLAAHIEQQLLKHRFISPVSLNGSYNTLQILEKWCGLPC